MTRLRQNDVLFAHKALNIVPGLSEANRRVAGAIIDHFNKKNGQCDPGIKRLCKLLGLNRATVIRSTEKLHEEGFIKKESHGGKSHRASYRPNWDYFRHIVQRWDERMRDLHGTERHATLPEGAKKPKNADNWDPGSPSGTFSVCQRATRHKLQEEASRDYSTASDRPRLEPMYHSKSPTLTRSSRREVARQVAQRRWENDVRNLGERSYAVVVEWITLEVQEAATDAEQQRKGGGLKYILAAITEDKCTSSNWFPSTEFTELKSEGLK